MDFCMAIHPSVHGARLNLHTCVGRLPPQAKRTEDQSTPGRCVKNAVVATNCNSKDAYSLACGAWQLWPPPPLQPFPPMFQATFGLLNALKAALPLRRALRGSAGGPHPTGWSAGCSRSCNAHKRCQICISRLCVSCTRKRMVSRL